MLREEFTRYRDYLTAPWSNKGITHGKTEIWQKIAKSVSSLGHASRSVIACKTRWRNLSSTARKVFKEHHSETKRTSRGPPHKASFCFHFGYHQPVEQHHIIQRCRWWYIHVFDPSLSSSLISRLLLRCRGMSQPRIRTSGMISHRRSIRIC